MLRVAVPNKGSLAEPAADMLRESGYRQRSDPRELVLLDAANDTEFFFLRPRDIATYVGSGELDVGITGRDLLLDSGAPAEEILPLGFAESTFRFAAKPGSASVVQGVTEDRFGIGYSGIGYKTSGVKAVALAETEAGAYSNGSYQDVTSGKYPLWRFLYIGNDFLDVHARCR